MGVVLSIVVVGKSYCIDCVWINIDNIVFFYLILSLFRVIICVIFGMKVYR